MCQRSPPCHADRLRRRLRQPRVFPGWTGRAAAVTIGTVTGGRTHWPTLAELEQLAYGCWRYGVTDLRDGDCRTGVDRIARGYVRSRGIAEVEKHPADWDMHGKPAGHIRNGTMLDGTTPNAKGRTIGIRADVLFVFKGGVGTKNCRDQAVKRGVEIVDIAPVAEPRIWNMHNPAHPPDLVYVGRSPKWGGWSPLANPFKLDPNLPRECQAADVLGQYQRWLWEKIKTKDPRVCAAIHALTAESFVGCTCWPLPCHGEIIVRAWRWLHGF